jgi:hypothetical protein
VLRRVKISAKPRQKKRKGKVPVADKAPFSGQQQAPEIGPTTLPASLDQHEFNN